MSGGKELRVKPETGTEQRPDILPGLGESRPVAAPLGLPGRLSDVQRQVLECLQEAGKGLTVRQLEARVLCPSDALQEALVVLLEQRLIARLNTIIPSYSCRASGVEVNTE
jgi:hypothetical protein